MNEERQLRTELSSNVGSMDEEYKNLFRVRMKRMKDKINDFLENILLREFMDGS